jgi:hypothetical protein
LTTVTVALEHIKARSEPASFVTRNIARLIFVSIHLMKAGEHTEQHPAFGEPET